MAATLDFTNKTYALFGLGRSGLAAGRFLQRLGAKVRAWDDNATQRTAAEQAGLPLVDPDDDDWHGLTALVLSPGVPLTHPEPHRVVRQAKSAGVEIIGDIELFCQSRGAARIAAVTGTNGKSTTTALIGHVLSSCGLDATTGGNIGLPVLDLPELPEGGVYVLEMSSYQLDLTPSLACEVAVLLNISPDHLDRHGGMAGYVAVKRRIFDGQPKHATAIVGIDDKHCRRIANDLAREGRKVVSVAVGSKLKDGISVVDGVLFDGTRRIADLTQVKALPGAHNWQNAAAAYATARALGLAPAAITAALTDFPGLAHRMERIAEIDGIAFVNDSKATNADAAARALASYPRIYWIAGGRAKAGGIAGLEPYFDHLQHVFLIGEASDQFAAELAGRVPFTRSGDLATAVHDASERARADDGEGAVVLLSPACASFDQFADFEARGEAFRTAVLALKGRKP